LFDSQKRHNIAILGSTGSIGCSTLEVIEALGKPYKVWAISAHQQVALFEQQIARHSPVHAVLTGNSEESSASGNQHTACTQRHFGNEGLLKLASSPEVDIVVAAIVGSAGLESALEAVRHGKTLALANKEALIVAGPVLMDIAKSSGARLMPIDSEHSAIFQSMQSGRSINEVKRVILTASGGSLRDWPKERLSEATIQDALAHPTWSMGRKITIDSATMMNKALEVIEAKWLFGLDPSKISVVIHPQSMIHSMVEFVDGSVIAQLSPPDMRLPIQYALTFPDRLPGPARTVDWTQSFSMDWMPVDLERYPALQLGFEVAQAGGTSGSVLNGANEAAVELFLSQKIGFTEIATLTKKVLDYHDFDPSPTLKQLMSLDQWARQELKRVAGC